MPAKYLHALGRQLFPDCADGIRFRVGRRIPRPTRRLADIGTDCNIGAFIRKCRGNRIPLPGQSSGNDSRTSGK